MMSKYTFVSYTKIIVEYYLLQFALVCTVKKIVFKSHPHHRCLYSSFFCAGPCHPNPCHNRGTCEISETYRGDTFIGYVCKCLPGFSGVHCQHSKLDQPLPYPLFKVSRTITELNIKSKGLQGLCVSFMALPGRMIGLFDHNDFLTGVK